MLFWINENLNRKARQSDLHQIEKLLKMYREIQILTKIYNNSHRDLFIPTFTWIWVSAFIVCTYVIISHYRSLDIFSITIIFYTALMGKVAILFCLHFPANIYSKSMSSLKTVKCAIAGNTANSMVNYSKGVKHLLLKEQKVLSQIWIGFGGNNYVDTLTPLTILDFGIDKVVSLVLLE